MITNKALHEIAEKTIVAGDFVLDDFYSPAEVFAGLVTSIVQYRDTDSLPRKVRRISPLGPMEMARSEPAIARVTVDQVTILAQEAKDYLSGNGSLPSNLTVGNNQIGTGSLFALFCTVYLDICSGRIASEYPVVSFDAYPKTNEKAIIDEIRGYKSWPVHRPDLDMSKIIEKTRLQLWTLKPAQPQRKRILNIE